MRVLQLLTLKQMFQSFPIALAQVKAGNIYENLLNKICQNIYSLYLEKEIAKKLYNNIVNLIKDSIEIVKHLILIDD